MVITSFPTPVLLIIIGVVCASILEVLFFISRWIEDVTKVHKLRADSHRLRLQLKMGVAQQIYHEQIYQAQEAQKKFDTKIQQENIDMPIQSPTEATDDIPQAQAA